MNFDVVIATYNRKESLSILVGQILACSHLPEKIIIVDDLIATGGTSEAAAKLVEKCGGEIAGFIFVINLFDLGGKKLLEKKGYKTFSLIDFPGH